MTAQIKADEAMRRCLTSQASLSDDDAFFFEMFDRFRIPPHDFHNRALGQILKEEAVRNHPREDDEAVDVVAVVDQHQGNEDEEKHQPMKYDAGDVVGPPPVPRFFPDDFEREGFLGRFRH